MGLGWVQAHVRKSIRVDAGISSKFALVGSDYEPGSMTGVLFMNSLIPKRQTGNSEGTQPSLTQASRQLYSVPRT